MEGSWEVVVLFAEGESRGKELNHALDNIHNFAQKNGLPAVSIKYLLKLLSCDRLKNIANRNSEGAIELYKKIISCMNPNQPLCEDDVDLLMSIVLLCYKNFLKTVYSNHLAAWFLFALKHGVISKKYIAENFYVVLLNILKVNMTQDMFSILAFTIKTVTRRIVINKRNSDIILEAWENINKREQLALIVEEFQKWNYLSQISLKNIAQLVIDFDSWPLMEQFIHMPPVEEEPTVKMICSGLPIPQYDCTTFGQSVLTFPTVMEMLLCLDENRLLVPSNPLSALATGPSQVLVAMMPANCDWMKKLFSDAKSALASYVISEALNVANALASLQEIARYPFPPLTEYWHSLANTWNGNLDSAIGKLLLRCIPYLQINSPEEISNLLKPLYQKFADASLEYKISILEKLAQLHVNLVTLVVGRQEPVPFTGQRPTWALDPKDTIASLAAEEEKFIDTFLEKSQNPGRILIAINFYVKIIMGEEVHCQVWTLPSDDILATWMTSYRYVVFESVCSLLNRYALFIVLLQKRGTSSNFLSLMERLQTLTRDTYRMILMKNLRDTFLGQHADGAFDDCPVEFSLLDNPAFSMVFKELIENQLIPSDNLTEEVLMEKMKLFAPECSRFIREWNFMDW